MPRRVALCSAAAGMLVTLGTTGAAFGQAEAPSSCGASQLDGVIEFLGPALGNRYARLVVSNQGAECTLQGYPGMQLVAADGRLLGTRVDPRPSMDPGPTTVTLPYLASAASELHWIVGPCFTEGDDGTLESRPVSVTVFPPGGTDGIAVPWDFGPVCGEPEGPSEIDATAFAAL